MRDFLALDWDRVEHVVRVRGSIQTRYADRFASFDAFRDEARSRGFDAYRLVGTYEGQARVFDPRVGDVLL